MFQNKALVLRQANKTNQYNNIPAQERWQYRTLRYAFNLVVIAALTLHTKPGGKENLNGIFSHKIGCDKYYKKL